MSWGGPLRDVTSGPIARAFRSLHDDVLVPSGAGYEQLRETRRAFYAGAMAVLDALFSGLSEGNGVEDSDRQLMQSVQQELDSFSALVGADADE